MHPQTGVFVVFRVFRVVRGSNIQGRGEVRRTGNGAGVGVLKEFGF
jgi:hypothetical protein